MSEQPSPAGYEEELNDPFEHEEPGVGETSIESILRKVLLEKQILPEEQLLECLKERKGKTPPPPLASLLLKKGYLDD